MRQTAHQVQFLFPFLATIMSYLLCLLLETYLVVDRRTHKGAQGAFEELRIDLKLSFELVAIKNSNFAWNVNRS